MEWEDVVALRAVGEHGSVTAAAVSLRVARPALSRRIARLEGMVGTPLLVRRARTVALTDAGRLLVEGAEQVEAVWSDAVSAVRRDPPPPRRGPRTPTRLRMAFGLISPQRAVPHLHDLFPATSWQFEQVPLPTAVERMSAGDLDLFYGWSMGMESPRSRGPLRFRALLEAPYAVAAAAGHWATRRPELRVADLSTEEWIVNPDPLIRDYEIRLCRRYGFDPTITHVAGDMAAVRALVAAGRAVTWVAGGLQGGDDYTVVLPVDAPLGRLVVGWNTRVLAGPDAERLAEGLFELNLDVWRERQPTLMQWLRRHGTPELRRRLPAPGGAGRDDAAPGDAAPGGAGRDDAAPGSAERG